VKNNNIKKGIFTALLLASPLTMAGTQYPAADFKPTVVYQDSDYQHQSSSTSAASASFGEKAADDKNYPAATFKPQVLFQDSDYKHTSKSANNNSIPLAVWEEAVEEQRADVAAEASDAENEDSMNVLFALMILAGAAFLYRKKGNCGKKSKATAKNTDGLTGVAKYLQNKAPKLSGVAAYLESKQSAPKSGVAKYVAKKAVSNRQAAIDNATGVEKYMRNQKRG